MRDFTLAIFAFLIAFCITPIIKKLAFKVKAVDIPKNPRKIHKKPIPLLGGLAIFIAFGLVLILKPYSLSINERGILIGALIIVIGGIIDDMRELKPWQKLAFQVMGALTLVFHGVYISYVTNPFMNFGAEMLNIGFISIPFTVIWVIGITNALNLIDGLDGLAAGIGFISSVTIYIVAVIADRGSATTLTAILAGSILGFLPYNFNPASIFMGDTGSQLLGFLLAAISMEGAVKSATAFAIAIPILAIGLPIYDTIFAMIRRKVNGKPMMQADRGHLHHRLLDFGFSQRQSVIIMYLISTCLGAVAILAMQISTRRAYVLLAMVILIIVIIAWKCGFFKKKD